MAALDRFHCTRDMIIIVKSITGLNLCCVQLSDLISGTALYFLSKYM